MFANHVYQMGRYHQLAILQTQSCPQKFVLSRYIDARKRTWFGFIFAWLWSGFCMTIPLWKSAFLQKEAAFFMISRGGDSNQSGKVGRWLLMFQSVDLFILFICWCWSLPNLVLGMLNSNQLRGHEFSSTIPRYPWSCAPKGYVQTRMPFILRLCNFDLTWNFGESELSTAPTAASPASRYKIPDIFGYVTEIYSFRLGFLRKRGLWWLMHTFDIWTRNDSRITLFANELVPCFGRTGIHQGTSD